MTPYERWNGSKPDVSHLRIFGSSVFSLIPKERRDKLDAKTREGVLVGYREDVKGYRIVDVATTESWYSHTVRIIEEEPKMQKDAPAPRINEPEEDAYDLISLPDLNDGEEYKTKYRLLNQSQVKSKTKTSFLPTSRQKCQMWKNWQKSENHLR